MILAPESATILAATPFSARAEAGSSTGWLVGHFRSTSLLNPYCEARIRLIDANSERQLLSERCFPGRGQMRSDGGGNSGRKPDHSAGPARLRRANTDVQGASITSEARDVQFIRWMAGCSVPSTPTTANMASPSAISMSVLRVNAESALVCVLVFVVKVI